MCQWYTVGALILLWSCIPGTHTLTTSVPKVSVPVSVPIRGRLCHLLLLHICMCKKLVDLWITSLDSHLLTPPSITRCRQESSDMFCVDVCDQMILLISLGYQMILLVGEYDTVDVRKGT